MGDTWKDWEQTVVNDEFPLQRLLGTGTGSAAFLTQIGGAEPRDATIKLVIVEPQDQEAQLALWHRAAELSHPHLVRIVDAGVCRPDESGLLYVVTEHADESLAGLLPERPMTEPEVREMLSPVLDAVSYLHAEGFAHGDLTPANILAFGDQIKVSSDCIREGDAASKAEDVRSVGLVVLEALTQRQDPQLASTLPPPFDRIAAECLDPDPLRRPAIAGVAGRLRPPLPPPAIRPLQSVPRGEETREAHRRRGIPVWAAAALAVAAIVGGTAILRHSPSSAAGATPAPVAASAPPAAAPIRPAAPPVLSREGHVVRQVLPEIPRQARDTIRGAVKISVRAAVNSAGLVEDAAVASGGSSKYLSHLTLEAARHWEFQPPKVDGRDVPSHWLVRFNLTRGAITVHPEQLSR